MFRSTAWCALILCAGPAWAQGVATPGSPGSPSNANSAISPTTVAQAFDDAQDASRPVFSVSLGSSIGSGRFGAPSRSRIATTSLGLRYTVGNLRVTASLPYMNVRSAGTILSGIDGVPVLVSRSTTPRRTTYDGIGDLTLGASYNLPARQDGLDLELSGRIKVPTARDSTGLSTGKVDYSLGAQVTKAFGAVAPFVSGTYRSLGDTRTFDLRDGFAASAGASVLATDNLVVLGSYHYAQAATRLIRDSHELFGGASMLLSNRALRITAFATKGLSSGAANVSGGLGIAIEF